MAKKTRNKRSTKKVKVLVLKNYKDLKLNRIVSAGEVLEVTEKRAKELLSHEANIVEVVENSKKK